jgi:large subunit ribosomal protein L19
MSSDLIREIEQEYLKTDLPELHPGDTVKVMVRIKEGNKERLQAYEGVIIKIAGQGGLNKTITVRKVFQGVGVERVFLIHSPKLESIKVMRRGRVRRAKLYYLRNRVGKAARIQEKVISSVKVNTPAAAGKA